MKFILVLLAFLFSLASFAEVIVVGGKPYEIKPSQLNVCGDVGSPEYAAAKFVIVGAKSIGEQTADAACKAGKSEMCSQEAKTKFWLALLFQEIRKYPSRFHSAGCASLRSECEQLCDASQNSIKETCQIECNQYEVYNR